MKNLSKYIVEKFKINKDTYYIKDNCKVLIDFFYYIDNSSKDFFESWFIDNRVSKFTVYFPWDNQLNKFKEQIQNNEFVEKYCKTIYFTDFQKIQKDILNTSKEQLEVKDYKKYEIYNNNGSKNMIVAYSSHKGAKKGLVIQGYSFWCIIKPE